MWKLNWTELGIDWDRLKDVLTYDASQPMIFSSGFFLLLFLGFSLIYLILQKKDYGASAVCYLVFLLFLL